MQRDRSTSLVESTTSWFLTALSRSFTRTIERRAFIGATTLLLTVCSASSVLSQSVPNPDELTEYSAHRWGVSADQGNASVQNDTTRTRVGRASLLISTTSPYRTTIFTPPVGNGAWDLSYTSGMAFWAYAENPNSGFQNLSPWIRLYTTANDYFEIRPKHDVLNEARGQWHEIVVPFQNYAGWRMQQVGNPNLRSINRIEINTDTWDFQPYRVWIDGLRFNLPPFPAANQMAIAGNNSVHLSWSAATSPSFLRYEIYRSTQPFTRITGLTPIATISVASQTEYTDTTAVNGRSYYYAVIVRLNNGAAATEVQSIGPRTPYDETDLQVVSISRTPRYPRYDPIYNVREMRESSGFGPYITSIAVGLGSNQNTNTQRFPRNGDTVLYTAHVRNRGTNPFSGVITIRWLLNEVAASEQRVNLTLRPGETTTYTFTRVWDDSDPLIRFNLVVNDARPANNTLAIHARSVGFLSYVDRSYLEDFRESSRTDTRATTIDFIDWLNHHMNRFNEMFAQARSPKRVHYDVLEVLDDYQSDPIRGDRICFAVFPYRFYAHEYTYLRNAGYYNASVDADMGLIHEWAHQLGLIDLYQINVEPHQNLVNGQPYRTVDCLMHNVVPFLSPHSAMAMTRWYNVAHGYYGQYLYEMPAQHRLLFLDADGRPLPNARITVYQLCERPGMGHVITNQVKAQGNTDAQGYYLLPNVRIDPNIAVPTAFGLQLRDNPYGYVNVVGSNGLLLMRIDYEGQTDWAWLSIVESNLAFWSGQTGVANFERRLRIRSVRVALSSISINPASVEGGCSSTGTVTLTAEAPAGGFVVDLSSSNSTVASTPTTVTVPAGQNRASFTVTTAPTSTQQTVTVTASAQGVSRTATLTIMASTVPQSLTLNPNSVQGGQNATGTVTLNRAAPACGVVVWLASSHPNVATVPASITIPAGQSSATFTITTNAQVAAVTNVAITATANGGSQSAQITVTPPCTAIRSVRLAPTSQDDWHTDHLGVRRVVSGIRVRVHVELNAPAPSRMTIQLRSSNTSVAGNTSLTIPAGQTSGSVTIRTQRSPQNVDLRYTATNACSEVRSNTLRLHNTLIKNLRVEPTVIRVGRSAWVTVNILNPASSGGYNLFFNHNAGNAFRIDRSRTVLPGLSQERFTASARKTHNGFILEVRGANGEVFRQFLQIVP